MLFYYSTVLQISQKIIYSDIMAVMDFVVKQIGKEGYIFLHSVLGFGYFDAYTSIFLASICLVLRI